VSGERVEAPLDGAVKDEPSVTADWVPVRTGIEGVQVIEVRNVLQDSRSLTEIYRADWFSTPAEVNQVFQIALAGGGITAWHMHTQTTDRLFVSTGHVKIVLFDARPESPTRGLANEFRFGERRPGLVVVPPGVWHGLRNLDATPSVVVNVVDRGYEYADPDHWRLPAGSPEIPCDL
jgi:dTDP-4-dehydrorhamnose 3,5-epimerase